MKNVFFISIAIFICSGTLLAQGVSNIPKAKPDLSGSKYNYFLQPKSFTNPKDLRFPLASKGLKNRSIENIGLYGKENKDSLIAVQPEVKLKFEPILYSKNMPIKRIKDKIHMPMIQRADSSVYHSLLRKGVK